MNGRTPRSRTRSERLGRVVTTVVFSLPLWTDLVAQALGYELFYLADPKLQAVWGTLVQLLCGWPLYTDALQQLRQGRTGRAVATSLFSTLLYAGGLYAAVINARANLYFLAAGGLILLGHLLDYRDSRRAA